MSEEFWDLNSFYEQRADGTWEGRVEPVDPTLGAPIIRATGSTLEETRKAVTAEFFRVSGVRTEDEEILEFLKIYGVVGDKPLHRPDQITPHS